MFRSFVFKISIIFIYVMKKTIYDTISYAIVFGMLGTIAYFMMDDAMNIPDVHKSNSTGECVEVINWDPEDNYTCEELPSKYNLIWVK